MASPEEISIIAEIDLLADRRPFASFSIVMGSGSRFDIGGRDAVAVGRSVIFINAISGEHYLLRQNQVSEVIVPGGNK